MKNGHKKSPWDREDAFLKQHRTNHHPRKPKWGRRILLVVLLIAVIAIIMSLFETKHSHNQKTTTGAKGTPAVSSNTVTVQLPTPTPIRSSG